jgi:hypothetical protein
MTDSNQSVFPGYIFNHLTNQEKINLRIKAESKK